MKKLALALTVLSTLAFGLEEERLAQDFPKLVAPLFSLGTPGTLKGVNGASLRYRAFPRKEGKGVIVIAPGYTESFLKYPELIYDLWVEGYSVYFMDPRGMGLSSRTLKNRQIVHVEKFEYYVEDLEKFVDSVVSQDPLADKKFLIGHSMGGLVGAHLLAKRPGLFRAAVLSAPMMDLDTGKYPRPVAVALLSGLIVAGKGTHYAPGYEDFDLDTYTLAASPTTQSAARFDLYKETLKNVPDIRMGGPSVLWVRIMLEQTRANRMEALGYQVRTPTLMLQPTLDSYTKPRGGNLFCGAAWNCRKLIVAGGKHETFREKDEFRTPALKATFEHFERN
jgi:lysophospholipase